LIISRSHLANLLKQVAIRRLQGLKEGRTSLSSGSVPQGGCSDVEVVEVTRRYVRVLSKAVAEKGARFSSFHIPDRPEVEATEESVDERAYFSIMNELGIEAISLRVPLKTSGYSADDLSFREGHWTRNAHAVAGVEILRLADGGGDSYGDD
jgi:hypothetical protein